MKRIKMLKLKATISSIAIFYLLFALLIIINGPTSAYFNDSESISNYIRAATQFEETKGQSSLKFLLGRNFEGWNSSCTEEALIYATIKNGDDSASMTDEGNFILKRIPLNQPGNPKESTDIVINGTFPMLLTGQDYRIQVPLNFPNISGKYMFQAFQEGDHPGTGIIWSETIEVDCENNEADLQHTQKNNESDKKNEEINSTNDIKDKENDSDSKDHGDSENSETTEAGGDPEDSETTEAGGDPEDSGTTETGGDSEDSGSTEAGGDSEDNGTAEDSGEPEEGGDS